MYAEKEKIHMVSSMATRNSTAGMHTHIFGKAMDRVQDSPLAAKVYKPFLLASAKYFSVFLLQDHLSVAESEKKVVVF